ncbi:pro-FMRFamide-related neuropeptide VF [Choloepus didactylus]|uniref:pro-FMRFamide-related neuropeptide VF n=1 Tax=Choloepus didactylus TaxID=27675 RepID=UPI00189E5DEC|nr:pro-FMRFamide-related neuropeptide VF [Choloepus didactylus]
MEIMSSKRFILLILATSSLLTSNTFCANELMMSNFCGKETSNKYPEPRGDSKEEKEGSLNFGELKDWGPKYAIKVSTPAVNKMPHSAANLPLRFGRAMEEERSSGSRANLPLRFGRNMEGRISRHVPNLPQRFGRTASAKSVTKALSNFLQGPMNSPTAIELIYSMTCQPHEVQNPDQKHPRSLGLKQIDDAELKQEK